MTKLSEELKILKAILPKKDKIVVRYFQEKADFPDHVICFSETKSKFILYETSKEEATVVGTSINPTTLEDKIFSTKSKRKE